MRRHFERAIKETQDIQSTDKQPPWMSQKMDKGKSILHLEPPKRTPARVNDQIRPLSKLPCELLY